MFVVAASIDGRLLRHDSPVPSWRDAGLALGIGEAGLEPDFALSRDVAIALVVALQVLATMLLVPQWRRLQVFLVQLNDSRMLVAHVSADMRLILHRVNSYYRTLGRLHWLILAASVCLAVLLFNALLDPSELFRAIAPENRDRGWDERAYDSWWGSTENIVGHFSLLIVASVAIYFRVLEASVGAFSMFVFVRHRGAFDFAADPANGDGAYGWRPLGRVFSAMYWSLAVDGATLVLLWLMLSGSGFGLVGLIVVIFGAVALFCGLAPYIVLAGPFRRFVETEVERVKRDAATALAGAGTDTRARLEIRGYERAEISALNAVTPFPLPKKLLAIGSISLPLAAAIAEIAGLFK
jgi:hypothetical protein